MKIAWPLLGAALWAVAGCSPSAPAGGAVSSGGTPVPDPKASTPGNVATTPERSSDESRVYARKDLAVRNVTLAGKPFRLWIMDNGGKRQEGMMFLRDEDVAADQGMLFAFTDVQKGDQSHGFWMRNCPLALDIVYLSPKNTVVNVGKGDPFNETTVPPAGDYKNVIELKQGTAARIGLKPGMAVALPKDLKPVADDTL